MLQTGGIKSAISTALKKTDWTKSAKFLALAMVIVGAYLVGAETLAQVQGPDANLANQLNLPTATTDLRQAVIRVVQYLLGFLGLLAVIIILYGGWLWMTSAGNAQRLENAKLVLKNGVIGLIIILLSWAIVAFISWWVFGGFNPGGDDGPPGPPGPGCLSCSALGNGIIDDHYPERDQGISRGEAVPRNVSLFITFREPILVDNTAGSFISNPVSCGATCWAGDLNQSIFTLVWSDNPQKPATDAVVRTVDERTFAIAPKTLMGSEQVDSIYEATVKSALTKKDGKAGMLGDYVWRFKVSTKVDVTPPRLLSVRPANTDVVPRNYAILMTFDDVINPISASGDYPPFNNIVVHNVNTGADLEGRFRIGNGYNTVYFLTNDACGKNSCGDDMFCLPSETDIRVTIKAAQLTPTPTNVNAGDPFAGVVDKASNSLDGQQTGISPAGAFSGDGASDGPPADNFVWAFKTSDTIISTGPEIVDNFNNGTEVLSGALPTPDSAGIQLNQPLQARFNRDMLPFSSFADPADEAEPIKSPVKIYAIDFDTSAPYTVYAPWWVRQSQVKVCSLTAASCEKNTDCGVSGDNLCGQSDAFINHEDFQNSGEYENRIANRVQDITQNCYNPAIGPLQSADPAQPQNSAYSTPAPTDWMDLDIYSDNDPKRLH